MTPPRRPLTVACLGVALVATACSNSSDARPVERELAFGPEVTHLAVAGGFEVSVTVGTETPSARVTVDADAVDDVRLEAEGDTLTIAFDGDADLETRPRAVVSLSALERVAVAAASTVEVVGRGSEDLVAGVSGASTLTITGVALRFLTIGVDGASLVAAEGTTASLEATVSGDSTATLDRLQATDAVLDIDGASTATVSASATLEVTAAGGSSVRYATEPAQLAEYTSGGSTVAPMED